MFYIMLVNNYCNQHSRTDNIYIYTNVLTRNEAQTSASLRLTCVIPIINLIITHNNNAIGTRSPINR